MTLITSEQDAALLDAGRRAIELAQRYRYSVEHLIEPESTRQLLRQRSDQLNTLAEQLADVIRKAQLLPREPDLEMSELHTLADQVSTLLDNESCSKLLERFAESERELLGELETAGDDRDSGRNRVLGPAIEETHAFLARLEVH